jgi:hypothetical protein
MSNTQHVGRAALALDVATTPEDTDMGRLAALMLDLRYWAQTRGVDFHRASASAYELYETQTNRKAGNCPVTAPETPGIKPWAMPETESEDTDNDT